MIIIKKDEECFVLVQKIARDKEIKYEYMKKKKKRSFDQRRQISYTIAMSKRGICSVS